MNKIAFEYNYLFHDEGEKEDIMDYLDLAPCEIASKYEGLVGTQMIVVWESLSSAEFFHKWIVENGKDLWKGEDQYDEIIKSYEAFDPKHCREVKGKIAYV